MIHVKPKDSDVFPRQFLSNKIKVLFVSIQILFSLDFGFIQYKSSKTKFCFKLFAFILFLCQGITILVFLFTSLGEYNQMWGIKVLLETYLYVLILIFTPYNGTFCFYQMELAHFDEQIGIESSSYKIDNKILLSVFLSFLFHIVWMSCSYIFRIDNYEIIIILDVLLCIPIQTFYLPLIVLFFVFYCSACRLDKLKIYIKKRKSSVERAHQLYRFLIDTLEKVLKTFKHIYLVNLIFNVPAIMASIYTLVKTIREIGEIKMSVFTPYLVMIHLLVVKFGPIVAASWLSREAINVKLILQNRLLDESSQRQAMERFIKYIEARPFKFYMLSMIPMDATLLVIVFNFCITYLVVLIQLTHIY